MKKQQQALKKLQDIVASDLPGLERNIIMRDGQDVIAFGHYKIIPQDGMFQVIRWATPMGSFSTSRLALSWCIADKYQKYALSHDIMRFSQQQNSLISDLRTRSALARSIKNVEWRENVGGKIEHKKQLLQSIEFQLDKCVNLAKYWQLRGFNNETARTGRPPSPRASR